MHVQPITPIVKLNLKLQCQSQVYMIIVQHIYFVSGTITVTSQAEDNPNGNNEEVVFKNCAPFADCISEINNGQIDNAKDIDVVRPMYNFNGIQ